MEKGLMIMAIVAAMIISASYAVAGYVIAPPGNQCTQIWKEVLNEKQSILILDCKETPDAHGAGLQVSKQPEDNRDGQ